MWWHIERGGCTVCAVLVVAVRPCGVCPHKWNTYGNLPQWSVGEGKGGIGEHQIIFGKKIHKKSIAFFTLLSYNHPNHIL